MEEALLFIEQYQSWIFILLALSGLIYLRLTYRAYQSYRKAIFGLERERARANLTRSASILVLVLAGVLAIFVLTTFATPALPPSFRPTPIPTVSLLSTPPAPESGVGEGGTGGPPSIDDVLDNSGCQNPDATLLFPEDGSTVNGVIELQGVASIDNFAFYKIEYNDLSPDRSWLAISANTEPVCKTNCAETEILGTWDTSLVTPGDYAVRLIVTDTLGNAPLPCTIRVRVIP
jgi:hypothetical protein